MIDTMISWYSLLTRASLYSPLGESQLGFFSCEIQNQSISRYDISNIQYMKNQYLDWNIRYSKHLDFWYSRLTESEVQTKLSLQIFWIAWISRIQTINIQTLLGCEKAWTPIIYLKSFDMDSVQVGKAVFAKESYITLGMEPRTYSYPGRLAATLVSVELLIFLRSSKLAEPLNPW